MLEPPVEGSDHNVVGNNKRDGLRTDPDGKSATKLLYEKKAQRLSRQGVGSLPEIGVALLGKAKGGDIVQMFMSISGINHCIEGGD